MPKDFEFAELTGSIIGAAIEVSNSLGAGFLEKVYQNALAYELGKRSLEVSVEDPIAIYYDGFKVGDYRADLVVARSVIVEVKAAKGIDDIHRAQLLNYLKATRMHVGILLNFGTPRLQVKRIARSLS